MLDLVCSSLGLVKFCKDLAFEFLLWVEKIWRKLSIIVIVLAMKFRNNALTLRPWFDFNRLFDFKRSWFGYNLER